MTGAAEAETVSRGRRAQSQRASAAAGVVAQDGRAGDAYKILPKRARIIADIEVNRGRGGLERDGLGGASAVAGLLPLEENVLDGLGAVERLRVQVLGDRVELRLGGKRLAARLSSTGERKAGGGLGLDRGQTQTPDQAQRAHDNPPDKVELRVLRTGRRWVGEAYHRPSPPEWLLVEGRHSLNMSGAWVHSRHHQVILTTAQDASWRRAALGLRGAADQAWFGAP